MVKNEDFVGKGKHQIWEELLDRNYDLGKKTRGKMQDALQSKMETYCQGCQIISYEVTIS